MPSKSRDRAFKLQLRDELGVHQTDKKQGCLLWEYHCVQPTGSGEDVKMSQCLCQNESLAPKKVKEAVEGLAMTKLSP